MAGMSSCNDGKIRQVTLGNGIQVGIQDLDTILDQVFEQNIDDPETLETELLNLVKVNNYVPEGAETLYTKALVKAYNRKHGEIGITEIPEPKKKHAG